MEEDDWIICILFYKFDVIQSKRKRDISVFFVLYVDNYGKVRMMGIMYILIFGFLLFLFVFVLVYILLISYNLEKIGENN